MDKNRTYAIYGQLAYISYNNKFDKETRSTAGIFLLNLQNAWINLIDIHSDTMKNTFDRVLDECEHFIRKTLGER